MTPGCKAGFVQADPAHSVALLWSHAGTPTAVPLLLTAMVSELRANDERWQFALSSSHISVAEWGASTGAPIVSSRGLAMLSHDHRSTARVPRCHDTRLQT